jgi:magnesium-transporting ATPase (P-type)
MMTGDQARTAMSIAYKVGMLWSRTAEQIADENTRCVTGLL